MNRAVYGLTLALQQAQARIRQLERELADERKMIVPGAHLLSFERKNGEVKLVIDDGEDHDDSAA